MEIGNRHDEDPAAGGPDGADTAGCLMAAHDAMLDHADLDAEALQAWFEFEEAAFRYGVDPDLSREELLAAARAAGCAASSCPTGCAEGPPAEAA